MAEITKNVVSPINRINDILAQAKQAVPDKTAFIFKDRFFKKETKKTFAEFDDDVRSLGSVLASIGESGGHIACIGENSYEWITVFLTALVSNGVFCPIDKELPFDDIANVASFGDVDIIFYSKKFEALFHDRRNEFPNVKYFIGFDRETSDGEFLSYSLLLKRGKELLDSGYAKFLSEKDEGNVESLKMLVFTSGTTGMAKGVMLSEKNLISLIYYGLQISTIYNIGLSVLPYHHTYEAVAGILVYIHHHSTTVINDSLAAVLKNMKGYRPEYIYLVPAFVEVFYKKIISNIKAEGKYESFLRAVETSKKLRKVGIDLRPALFKAIRLVFGGRLKKIVCGGAPIRREVAEFFDNIGITLCNGYGITECSPLVSANQDNKDYDYTTVGVPLPCVNVTVENVAEDGNGEICVQGDTVMLGYYKMPEETERVLIDGVFHTGDLGHIRDDGKIVITGRCKNLIVLDNGKNIYPEELEGYIGNIPYIQEVIVKAGKDAEKTILVAELFLSKDAIKKMEKAPSEEEILADIKNSLSPLPSYKTVSRIEIRDKEFEKNSSNKIKRQYAK